MGKYDKIYKMLDEYEKNAMDIKGLLLSGLGIGLGGLIAGPILSLEAAGISALRDYFRKRNLQNQGFEALLNANPELREENQEKVKQLYNILIDYSPSIAKNPIIAGNWVKTRLQYEGRIEPTDINTLLDVDHSMRQKNIIDITSESLARENPLPHYGQFLRDND